MRRIAGLDSIRFFCALTVVVFHLSGPPIFAALPKHAPVVRILLGLYDTAFNGQAAVIAFFVISGFCIHFPYASGRPFAIVPFLVGRFVRIMVPTGAYLLLLTVLPFPNTGLTILLWSVWCELAYYALYPWLRWLFARTSVVAVLGGSYAAAAAVIAYTLHTRMWPGFFNGGGSLTWVAGLPCWLLGCLLAERFPADSTAVPPVSPALIWTYRAGAAGLGSACFLAMLHLRTPFLISLHLFAVFVYFWVRTELRWYLDRPANPWFERLGSLTFSIYLVHTLGARIWEHLTPAHGLLAWTVEFGFVLILGAVFYGLVERPSHRLARTLSRTPGRRAPAVLPEAANPG